MRNAFVGLAIAVAAALIASDARIVGVEAWKVVMGLVGFMIFRSAARESRGTTRESRGKTPS